MAPYSAGKDSAYGQAHSLGRAGLEVHGTALWHRSVITDQHSYEHTSTLVPP